MSKSKIEDEWEILSNSENESVYKLEEKNDFIKFNEVPGLLLCNNIITEEKERELLYNINNNEWEFIGKRKVQQYGYKYCYNSKTLKDFNNMPNWLIDLSKTLNLPYPDNVIINKYEPGQGISPHIDNLCFGKIIASLSLLSSISMSICRNMDEHAIILEPRSLIIFTEDSRYKWTHGIVPRKSDIINGKKQNRHIRISITFRTLAT